MNRHAHIDPVFASLLAALAPDNPQGFALPITTPPRDPCSDETVDDNAPASQPRESGD
jgi:hypothetical protein